MEDAEKTYGTWDLPVPTKSLAQINNLRQSENIQLDQSREPLLTWAPKVPKTHPMNYAVPNFGEDGDITNTNNSIAQEEARQKYTWTPKIDPKTETWAYIPTASIEFKLNEGLQAPAFNFAQQAEEINYTQQKDDKENIQLEADADEKLEVEVDADVDAEEGREPLKTWKVKPPKGHPVDYFVPDFGVDGSIRNTLDNLALAEKITGHNWQYVNPKDRPKPNPTDYAVPNFGVDQEI